MSFELKLAFLRELGAGHKKALAAFERLQTDPADTKAVDELYVFFHNIAGTAGSIDMPLLGSLACVCETIARMLRDKNVAMHERFVHAFKDGIAGVQAVLDQHGISSVEQRSSSWMEPAILQPGDGDERVLSKVLVIDDDRFSAGLIDSCLRAAGFLSSTCTDSERALEIVSSELPDLIVLDVVMPKLDGFELCRRVRAHPALQFTPIIFVTRKGDVDQRVRGLEVGGSDYIAKPFEPEELVARVRSHLTRLAALREMAIRDGLTRCYNHKYFKTRLVQEIARSKRYETPLALALLDVDKFKDVNDTYGHIVGDSVLAHLSGVVQAALRTTDVVARYGGEEFGLLLVQAGVEEASIVTNRLRERIANQRFPIHEGAVAEIPVTVSIGVTQLSPDDDVQSFLKRADGALYEAKANGRNRVHVWPNLTSS